MTELKASEISFYKSCFKSFDKNGDGKIDKHELKAVIEEMGLKATPKEIKKTLAEFDTNEDGVIDWPEFLNMLGGKSRSYHNEAELRRGFRKIDTNGDGNLSTEELQSHFERSGLSKEVSKEDVKQMMKELDTNQDGMIQYEEFLAILYL